VDIEFSEGTFFGSTPGTIEWYCKTFYRYHDHYISTPPIGFSLKSTTPHHHPHVKPPADGGTYPPFHFVGKDQTLINALMFLYPHRFFTVVSPERQGMLPEHLFSLPAESSSLTSDYTSKSYTPPSLSYILTRTLTFIRYKLLTHLRLAGNYGDEWFYFQFWFAGRKDREGMCDTWMMGGTYRWRSVVDVSSSWGQWWWKRNRSEEGSRSVEVASGEDHDDEREKCLPMRGFPVEVLLERLYGARWVERVRAWGE